jgi:hypothetical protein
MKKITIVFLAFLSLLISCTQDETWSSVDQDLVDVNTVVVYSDTATIRCYTIVRDSVETSGLKIALVGRYTDGEFGTVTASSYFRINMPTSITLNKDATFDSINIKLRYTGEYYGDTAKNFSLNIYEITEKLEDKKDKTTDYLYNFNTTACSHLLGHLDIIPRPNVRKDIEFRLKDSLGTNWFQKIKDNDDEFLNTENFLEFFKGIALVSANSGSSSILSFKAVDSTFITLNYHYHDQKGKIEFVLYNTDVQYNKFESERSNTVLKDLKYAKDDVSSYYTNNQTYCQAGSGIMTKIEFPYIKQFVQDAKMTKIVKAQLVLCPIKDSYDTIPLPTSLNLLRISKTNEMGGTIKGSDGNALTPTLYYDYVYNENTQYVFDVTSFVNTLISDKEPSYPDLAVTIPLDNNLYFKTLNRVIFGDIKRKFNKAELRLTMWKY